MLDKRIIIKIKELNKLVDDYVNEVRNNTKEISDILFDYYMKEKEDK